MTLANTTHVNFRGDARAALEFYASVFGGELTIVTYGQGGRAERPDEADLVMWGQVAAPSGFRIMAFDVPASRTFDRGVESFFEAVRTTTLDEAQAVWDALAADARSVRDEFGPAQWSQAYGMLTDRFGITWVVDVEAQY